MSLATLLNEPYNQDIVLKKLNSKIIPIENQSLNGTSNPLIASILHGKVFLTQEQLIVLEEKMHEVSLETYLFLFRGYCHATGAPAIPLSRYPVSEADFRELNRTLKNPVIEKFLMNPDLDFLLKESLRLHLDTMYLNLTQSLKKNLKSFNLFKSAEAVFELIVYQALKRIL